MAGITDGKFGIVTLPFFLAAQPPSGQRPGLEVWFDHVDYLANLGGWQYLGIGTDWPLFLDLRIIFPAPPKAEFPPTRKGA